MLYIFISILVVSITVLVIIKFMMWITQVTTHASITSHFQDAEYIINNQKIPDSWHLKASLFKRLMQGTLILPKDPKRQTLKRFDTLINFFEQSRFFDTPEAKTQLLTELKVERDRLQNTPAETILPETS